MDTLTQQPAHASQEQQQERHHPQQQQEHRAPTWRVTYLLQSTSSNSHGWRRHKSPHEVTIQPSDATPDSNSTNASNHLVVRDALNAARVQERVPLGNRVESLLQAAYVYAPDGNNIVRFALSGRAVKKFAVMMDSGRSATELCQALDRQGVRVRGMEDLPDVVFLRGDEQRSAEALEANIPNLSRPEVQAYIVRLLFQDSFHEFVRDLSEMFSHVQSHIPLPRAADSSEHSPATRGLAPPPGEMKSTLTGTAMTPTSATAPKGSCNSGGLSVAAVELSSAVDSGHQNVESDGISRCALDVYRLGIDTNLGDVGCNMEERGTGDVGKRVGNDRDVASERRKAASGGRGAKEIEAGRGHGSGWIGGRGARGRGRLGVGRGGASGGRRGRGANAKGAVRGGRENARPCGSRESQGFRGGAKGRGGNITQQKRRAETKSGDFALGKLDKRAASKHPRMEDSGAGASAFGPTKTTAGLYVSPEGQEQRPSGAAAWSPPFEPVLSSMSGDKAERSQVQQSTAVGLQPTTAKVLFPGLELASNGGSREDQSTERESILARAGKLKRPVGAQKPTVQRKPVTGRSIEGRVGTKNTGRAGNCADSSGSRSNRKKTPQDADTKSLKDSATSTGAGAKVSIESLQDDRAIGGQKWRVGMPTPVAAPTTSGRAAGLSATLVKIWSDVNKHPSAWPFCKAVDPAEVPGYLEVVKHPIDLSSIRERLNGAMVHYTSKEMLYDDLVLMCQNAMLYFHKSTDFYRAAEDLKRFIVTIFSP